MDGGHAARQGLGNISMRHLSVKNAREFAGDFGIAGAKQRFLRRTFSVGELNELSVSSQKRMIATSMAVYQNFNYKAHVTT
jgi:hypothetical protein